MDNIVMLALELLYPHPDNPRRDVGDVTELADSIKKNGVMQNLTVVSGHYVTEAKKQAAIDAYKAEPTEDKRVAANRRQSPDGYTVIIGHRRLAAAKAAGLDRVPCVIADMDPKTQVATMLLENMQRVDLTLPEQAEGMQMMIDLGSDVAEISRKTGIGETAVRRRLQVASLDRDRLMKSWDAGGCTLEDYVAIARLKSRQAQNRCLKEVGTRNFAWTLQKEIKAERCKENRKPVLDAVKKAGIPAYTGKEQYPYWHGYDSVLKIKLDAAEPMKDVKLPKKTEDFCYLAEDDCVHILRKSMAKKAEKPKLSKAERESDAMRAALSKKCKEMLASRRAFAAAYRPRPKDRERLTLWLIRFAATNSLEYLGIDEDFLRQKAGDNPGGVRFSAHFCAWAETAENAPFVAAYALAGDFSRNGEVIRTYRPNYGTTKPEHKPNPYLQAIYAFLEECGYTISDEERQMLDGTHPLYGGQKNEAEND